MKFFLNFNQKAWSDNGFKIDIVDAIILDFVRDFCSSPSSKKLIDNGHTYTWLSHQLICNGLPVLDLKKDSAYRRMKKICEHNFLAPHPDNKQLNQSWYRQLPNFDLLFGSYGQRSDGSAKLTQDSLPHTVDPPMGYGSGAEGGTDENPDNYINKDYLNNNIVEAPKNSQPIDDEKKIVFCTIGSESPSLHKVISKLKIHFDPETTSEFVGKHGFDPLSRMQDFLDKRASGKHFENEIKFFNAYVLWVVDGHNRQKNSQSKPSSSSSINTGETSQQKADRFKPKNPLGGSVWRPGDPIPEPPAGYS